MRTNYTIVLERHKPNNYFKGFDKDEGKEDLQLDSFYSTPISNRQDRVSIMIATCLQHR